MINGNVLSLRNEAITDMLCIPNHHNHTNLSPWRVKCVDFYGTSSWEVTAALHVCS